MSTGAARLVLGEWSVAAAAPGRLATPAQVESADLSWVPAAVPGTVAQALRAAGRWDIDDPIDFDAQDWWYRCSWRQVPDGSAPRQELCFAGLATLADVWLNGQLILTADNMFRTYRVDVTNRLGDDNELFICFRALGPALAARRPRPRWKTRLVRQQQLRWFRTTLLGRIPGWTPPIAPVGPWRPIALESLAPGAITDVVIRPSLEGRTGVLDVSWWTPGPLDGPLSARVTIGDVSRPLHVQRFDDGCAIAGQARVEGVAPWWPHTHGAPALYPCVLRVVNGSRTVAERWCDPIGFACIEANTSDDDFAIVVNGLPIFCRGACWTVNDIVSLAGDESELRRTLALLRDAGANMVRVGGTMVYESDAFYRGCDELGLLVWQDFMFANMDYPAEHETFVASVEAEAADQLRRLSPHASVAIYCGNSEVEQQAAMLGLPRDVWRGPLFDRVLPDLCARWDPRRPYVPSTPTGGALPFHVGAGISHYYGVGAYLRPLEDVRRANVRFTPECLGFANVPDPSTVDEVFGGDLPAVHDPRWKRRTPRDTGAGWDFEDVRDHYLSRLFSVDPVRLRSADVAKYLDLSRVTTGEVMARTFAEWRRASSTCHGALVWFLKDFWPGAGWGILDSHGAPKPCFYFLRRAWQPQAVLITDEGLDGLHLHVVNDADRPLKGRIRFALFRGGGTAIADAEAACGLEPHGRRAFQADALLDGFHDVAYAYRFGPPQFDVAAATLSDDSGQVISEAFWFPEFRKPALHGDARIGADVDRQGAMVLVTLTTDRFLYAAHIDAPGFLGDDNYFCLLPGRTKIVRFRALADAASDFSASIGAVNLDRHFSLQVRERPRAVTA